MFQKIANVARLLRLLFRTQSISSLYAGVLRKIIFITQCMALPVCVLALSTNSVNAATRSDSVLPQIIVNGIGYFHPDSAMALLMRGPGGDYKSYSVRDQVSGGVVYRGFLGVPVKDKHTKLILQEIDLSDVTAAGDYKIEIQGVASESFRVGTADANDLLVMLLRSYMLQRCGEDIQDPVSGMHRPACHLDDGLVAHSRQTGVAEHHVGHGGWHDAGDYGKYVATTSVALLEILSRYAYYKPSVQRIDLQYSSSDETMPDVLVEMSVGLNWLLRVQRSDGAFFRKLSGRQWPLQTAPHLDHQARWLYGISTPDTAKAVAALALAARVYADEDIALSASYLQAAKLGWQWLEQHPEMFFDYHEGDDSGSGPYRATKQDAEESIRYDRDDRLAAATELFLVTGDADYENYFLDVLPRTRFHLFEWKDPASLSLWNYYYHSGNAEKKDTLSSIQQKTVDHAEESLNRVRSSAFRLANHRFVWGSNKMNVEEGIVLLHAYRMTGSKRYLNAAFDQLHYVLGRNLFSKIFVTGFGDRGVENVSHILVHVTARTIPGLFVGGANENAEDGIAPGALGPASYLDDSRSYATNEYAIDYNSALIALLLDLLHHKQPIYQ